MIVRINSLYGMNDCSAYYRKSGGCFDFVTSPSLASDMSKEDAYKVVEHQEWYCKQFGASSMEVVDR